MEIDPNNSVAIYNLANTYLVKGEQKEAIQYFEKAIEKNPDNIEWRNFISGIYMERKNLEKAE